MICFLMVLSYRGSPNGADSDFATPSRHHVAATLTAGSGVALPPFDPPAPSS